MAIRSPWLLILTPLCLLTACESPLINSPSTSLQQRVITEAQQWADQQPDYYANFGTSIPENTLNSTTSSSVTPLPQNLDLGPALDDQPESLIPLSLSQALQNTLQHNVDNQIARLTPRLAESEVIIEQSEFDWTAFASGTFGETDQPQAATALGGTIIGVSRSESTDANVSAGIRKRIQLGGTIELSTGLDYANDSSAGLELSPDPSWTSNFSFSLSQPLLRDAGIQVTRARIDIAQNASQREIFAVQDQVANSIAQTETAYWQLFSAYHQLAIQQELLEETNTTFEKLQTREDLDVNPVQLAQAEREVHLRQAAVIQAQQVLRSASDQLKLVMNTPDLPLLAEALIQPTDFPDELPLETDLRDAVAIAIAERPAMKQLLLDIEDASIQLDVAENQLQPRLDLVTQVRHFGFDDEAGKGIGDLADNDTLDYSVGLSYEQPLENRGSRAGYLRSRIGTQIQELRYTKASQELALGVKSAIRNVHTNYQLWKISQQERRAAYDHLAAIKEREEIDQDRAQAASFLLDLKLRAQERLADAEAREIIALANYNIAITQYQFTLGTLLQQRGVTLDQHTPAPSENPTLTTEENTP